jgi:hypothetical protein
MGTLSFPFTLTAGQPENINQLNSNLAAIQAVINGAIDDTNLADNAVTTAKITDGDVTAAKIEDQPAWSTVSISGSGITTTSLGYYKDSLGVVHFRGDIVPNTGAVANGTALGTLPAGSRPGTNGAGGSQSFPLLGDRIAYCTISTAGVITLTAGLGAAGAGNILFSGITFRAEN